MRLWTIQPKEVYDLIQNTGVYHCDITKTIDAKTYWKRQYDFLVKEMKERIGNPPTGVTYPVWARYKWEGERKKPDLRRERWNWYNEDHTVFSCMEIEIPDDEVVLTDFDAWGIILNNGLISYTESEDKEIDKHFATLSTNEKEKYRDQNWKRVFDVKPRKNSWMTCGETIQATFWELKKEQIINVRFFKSKTRKEK